ncbi:MAG: hypothetical protein HY959_10285 [Ignavibacteriae bacterium]|nr:hypothetical protein [Ignavibacteriota bacterium]
MFNNKWKTSGIILIFTILIFMSIGVVYLPYIILAFSFLFLIFIIIYAKSFVALALTSLAVILITMTITIDSPYRETAEIIPLAIIPIYFIYLINFPKIVNGFEVGDNYVKYTVILMALLSGWTAISLFWTHDIYHGVNVALTFLAAFLVMQIFLLIEDKETLFNILWFFPFLGLVFGIFLLLSHWYSWSIGTDKIDILIEKISISISIISDKGRPGGVAPPDLASAIMNMFIFINIALMYRARQYTRIMLGLLSAFLVICILLTASKVGMISLFMGFVLLIFFMPHLQAWRFRMFSISAFFFIIALAAGGNRVIKRILLMIEKGISVKNDRLGWWMLGFEKLSDTYGLGLGAGGYLKYIDPVPGVHGFYFSIIFDLGIVGILFFLAIIIMLLEYIRNTLKVCKDPEMVFMVYCFVVSLISMGIHSLVQEDFQSLHVWLLLALVITVLRIAMKVGGAEVYIPIKNGG